MSFVKKSAQKIKEKLTSHLGIRNALYLALSLFFAWYDMGTFCTREGMQVFKKKNDLDLDCCRFKQMPVIKLPISFHTYAYIFMS